MVLDRSAQGLLLSRALARARALAEQVRETAERVHQQARGGHRLTEIARHQAVRGRELSKAAPDEARGVVNSIKWGVDTAANGKSRRSGDEDEADRPQNLPFPAGAECRLPKTLISYAF